MHITLLLRTDYDPIGVNNLDLYQCGECTDIQIWFPNEFLSNIDIGIAQKL